MDIVLTVEKQGTMSERSRKNKQQNQAHRDLELLAIKHDIHVYMVLKLKGDFYSNIKDKACYKMTRRI